MGAAVPAAAAPPPGIQSNADFAASGSVHGVSAVSATTQRVSCYAPEVLYLDALAASAGYPDGGGSPCDGAATTGEDLGPYPTQDVTNPALRVKDHSESDLRIDPNDANHLIGQSKWAVNAEGYNHLLGFYESFDGGATWPVQGHVPGYEGWTDNTDPVGAFDRVRQLLLADPPLQLLLQQSRRPPGSTTAQNQPNPDRTGQRPSPSRYTRHRSPDRGDELDHDAQRRALDYLMTASNAQTNDPDKQWITIDTNPASPHYGRIYAMWTIFVLNP